MKHKHCVNQKKFQRKSVKLFPARRALISKDADPTTTPQLLDGDTLWLQNAHSRSDWLSSFGQLVNEYRYPHRAGVHAQHGC